MLRNDPADHRTTVISIQQNIRQTAVTKRFAAPYWLTQLSLPTRDFVLDLESTLKILSSHTLASGTLLK